MKSKVILEISSALLILLFIYAATSKLLAYEEFKIQLSKSPFINQFASTTAWILPAIEILVGIGIIIKQTRLFALHAALFLMTMFTAYIYAMQHYSYYIPCSCGGVLSKMTWTKHFYFNIIFVVVSIVGIVYSQVKQKSERINLQKTIHSLTP